MMDAFLNFFAQFFMGFCAALELLSTIGGILFLFFLLWAATSRKAYAFFEWVYEEFFR